MLRNFDLSVLALMFPLVHSDEHSDQVENKECSNN